MLREKIQKLVFVQRSYSLYDLNRRNLAVGIDKTGINFFIEPGDLVQDLTYFEIPTTTKIEMEDLVNFPGYYVVVYTNWRYIETVYDNPLKIEATLYNPITRKVITDWNNSTNRIILGIFKYTIEPDNTISLVEKIDDDIFLENSNIILNGLFDEKSFKFWTAINSTLRVQESGGIEDTPYLRVTPIADNYQGIGQVVKTKTGYNYEVSFYVRAEESLPFQVLALDGTSLYNMSAPEIGSLNLITPKNWQQFVFTFQAISNNTALFFLKMNDELDEPFEIDSIFALEYIINQKQTDINRIKVIDGGLIDNYSN